MQNEKNTDHKYTKDGRKVVVIGKLNAAESIVQEIFCTEDGAEIPSGEQFVVKTLLDAPAVSWKEKKLTELEVTFESRRKRLRADLDRFNSDYSMKIERTKALIKATEFHHNACENQTFKRLLKFISGEITHVVLSQYNGVEIQDFEHAITRTEDRCKRFDSLRLLSLYGSTDGTFEWRLGYYSDGSGGGGTTVTPASSMGEAVEICNKTIRDTVEKGQFMCQWIDQKKQYGLSEPSEERIREYYAELAENTATRLETLKADVVKCRESLAEANLKAKAA